MATRLLQRKEIDRLKADEKRKEIAEGMKLATRVDSLRETQAQEEAALEKFRRETVFAINEEIIQKSKERDSLVLEVKELEERKAAALKPLDEERGLLEETRKELQRHHDRLDIKLASIKRRETVAETNYAASSDELARAKSAKELAEGLARDADRKNQEANRFLSRAQMTHAKAEKERREIGEVLDRREKEATLREKKLDSRGIEQDKRELGQNARERALNDKYETLIKTTKRTKNG